MKILVLGVTGMLGNAMIRVLAESETHDVWGTTRLGRVPRNFASDLMERIIPGINVENFDVLTSLFHSIRPEVVVNCVGLVKQRKEANDPLHAIPINSLLPHRLSHLCSLIGSRLIHFSTDCVFNGCKGGYRESDVSDAEDLYGKSKFLGEVAYQHTVTLRTSIIGHELKGNQGLVDWFLSQQGRVAGYRHAIFSGLPTVELSRVVRDVVLPRGNLFGVYHVAASPIAKYDLLDLIASAYGKSIQIEADESVVIDRSLNAERFKVKTGYEAPPWTELVFNMRDFG